MEERPSVGERAFRVAKSANIAELSAQLAAEDYTYSESFLAGRSVILQITRMIAEARISPTL